MGLSTGLKRVTARSKCPVCGKPDWCVVSDDGKRVFCPRVESNHGWRGDLGYLHFTDLPAAVSVPVGVYNCPRPPDRSHANLMRIFRAKWDMDAERRRVLCDALSLPEFAVDAMGAGIMGGSVLAFPMRDEYGRIVGIRYRDSDGGGKWAERGSINGLFVPHTHDLDSPTFIVEGPTDAAALVAIDANVFGLPSSSSGLRLAGVFAHERTACLIMDRDAAGERCRMVLSGIVPKLIVITPPDGIKDSRQWVMAGLTKEQLEAHL